MATIGPVDAVVNPNNTAQRYVLHANGRIDAYGGAVPITDQKTWYTRFEGPAVAIHVSNWTTGAGYVLDYRGGFNPFGGNPELGSTATDGYAAGVPAVSGIAVSSTPKERRYVDWSWDPSGTGQGYVMDAWGQLLPFGGALPPTITGRRFASARARKLAVRWTPRAVVIMDAFGRLYGNFGTVPGNHSASWKPAIFDAYRDLVVMDWTTGSVSGYQLDLYGGMHQFGGRPDTYGWPYNQGGDYARALVVLSASNPERFWQVWGGGQQFDYASSTPPTVTAGGVDNVSPATTVTTTTRPDLLWDYTDPQQNTQAAWQVLVFTQAWATGHSMTNPLAWTANALVFKEGIDANARGITCPVDLANGTYRMYVRAKDTAGQWSAWSNRGWTQNVPAPTTPTGLTATANQAAFSVALSVSATTGGSANLIRFEASDDGGATWAPVRGASAVTLATTTTATDYDAPLGVTRQYRAVAYAIDPRVASAPSNVVSATLTTLTTVLRAVDDPTLGGRVFPEDRPRWVRNIPAGEFFGIGSEYPTIVKGSRPRARRATVRFTSLDAASAARIVALVESNSTLVYRDARGEVIYCQATGEWPTDPLGAITDPGEITELQLVEVRPPLDA